MTKKKKWSSFLLAWMLLATLLFSGCDAVEDILSETDGKEVSGSVSEHLEVHYIDVGQGDSALIKCGSHAMLIDAGNNDKSEVVRSYLESQKIERLDLVIGTHGDADHIGGLDVAIQSFDCGKIWMPDRERDTKTYRDVISAIKDKGYTLEHPEPNDVFMLGGAEVKVVAPVKESYGNNENDYSIGVLITFGENKFLFTGDAEEDAEKDILSTGIDIDCDVFKAAHHGSSNANTSEFLDAALPEYVVISCEEGNDYGHPHAEVMIELRSRGIKVFRTDEQGLVLAKSDGKNITFNMSPSDSWLSGTQLKSDKENAAEEVTIIGNANSKKYHTTDCGNLPEEKNRVYFKSESEAKEQGYEKCKNCSS